MGHGPNREPIWVFYACADCRNCPWVRKLPGVRKLPFIKLPGGGKRHRCGCTFCGCTNRAVFKISNEKPNRGKQKLPFQ